MGRIIARGVDPEAIARALEYLNKELAPCTFGAYADGHCQCLWVDTEDALDQVVSEKVARAFLAGLHAR